MNERLLGLIKDDCFQFEVASIRGESNVAEVAQEQYARHVKAFGGTVHGAALKTAEYAGRRDAALEENRPDRASVYENLIDNENQSW